MLSVKINGIGYKLPLAWEEVTLSQYLRFSKLGKEATIVDAAAALLGIEVNNLVNSDDTDDFWLKIGVQLGYLTRLSDIKVECPKVVDCNGKVLEVQGFTKMRFGQKSMFHYLVIDSLDGEGVNIEAYARLLAIAFVSEYVKDRDINAATGKPDYNPKDINDLEAFFLEYPILEVQGLINFFLKSWLKSIKQNKNILVSQTPSLYRRMLKGLRNLNNTHKSE